MKFYSLLVVAALFMAPFVTTAQTTIASNDFDNPVNLTSTTITVDNPFTTTGNFGDLFGVTNANTGAPDFTPFSIVDDSDAACPSFFPNDTQGSIVCSYGGGLFFGMTDTENGDNMGDVTAEWVFDISSANNITGISIDMAAMGDFETSNDNFVWSYSIDGSAFVDIFDMMPDEAISADYTMADGDVVTLNDPMKVNGTLLLNNLTTFNAGISGSGSNLTLRLVGMGDGGSESLVWDNIVISGFTAGAPIPTMSQWATFLFMLIMVSFGLVFVYKSQARLAMAEGVSVSANNQTVPFDKAIFQAALKTAMLLTIPGFALIYMVWGEVVSADFIGMALTIPVVAYLIHLVKLFGKK